MEQKQKNWNLAANGQSIFGNPNELGKNSKFGNYAGSGLVVKEKPCSLDSLDSIHASYAENTPFEQKNSTRPKYVKSSVVFRPSDDKSAPYTFIAQRIGKPNFLQWSDLLAVVCQTLEEQRIELVKEARRFWANNHETILQVEIFDNTGLNYNRVAFFRRTFSPEGKPTGTKVWKKKESDFFELLK